MTKAVEVYTRNSADVTKAFYAEMARRGPIGELAVNLMRAQKRSMRAKVYRGRYKGMGYDVKQWSMDRACELLNRWGEYLGIAYGWKQDPATLLSGRPSWVLYLDLPQGQVSFHSPTRGEGPDYPGEWDDLRKSAEHIIEFCDSVMAMPVSAEVPA